MSPRFDNDPTKVQASFEVLPKDTYEFQVGEPKSFFRQNNKGNDSYGIRFPLVVMSDNAKGKRVVFNTYQQSEGAQAMAKQFVMAVLGYGKGKTEEKRFDAEYAGKDWSFDTDTNAVGDMWRSVTGQRVVGDLDTQISDTGDEQQKFVQWRPIGS